MFIYFVLEVLLFYTHHFLNFGRIFVGVFFKSDTFNEAYLICNA